MNDRLTAKLRMYKQLLTSLKRYASEWQALPVFAKAVQTLEEEIKAIEALNPSLLADVSGVTTDKGTLKSRMIDEALSLSGSLQAYAHDIGSAELETSATISRNDFRQAKEMDSDDLALHLYQLGVLHVAQLPDYGTTQTDLDILAGYIDSFSEKIGQPKDLLKSNQSIRSQQQVHFDNIDVAINKKLDNLIERFKLKNVAFYEEYQRARTISRIGGRNTVKGEPAVEY